MKFLTLSLIGFGFLAQQSQSQIGVNSFFSNSWSSPQAIGDPLGAVGQAQGFPNLANSFGSGNNINNPIAGQVNPQTLGIGNLRTDYSVGSFGSTGSFNPTGGSFGTFGQVNQYGPTNNLGTSNPSVVLGSANPFRSSTEKYDSGVNFGVNPEVNPVVNPGVNFGGLSGTNSGVNSGTNINLTRPVRNPTEDIDKSKWLVWDQSQKFCTAPRSWNGQSCVCSGNGIYMSGKCYNSYPKDNSDALLALRYINRNFDGTQNNPNNPMWGAKSTAEQRFCSANYQDGKSIMWSQLPNPRIVSNSVGSIGKLQENRLGLNMLFAQWGQFLDHDITLTPTGKNQTANIPIPMCDTNMDKNCTGTQSFSFSRSIFDANKTTRINMNVNTAWIDASQVYGSDKDTADSLRSNTQGKLKTSTGNFLPKDSNGQFLAGDFRVNENIALTTFQTVFLREHNRICDIVLSKSPSLSDEEIYQIARNYVTALLQHITFDEYLPALLGQDNFNKYIGAYRYDVSANPNIMTEFSTASFRLGHPLINAPFKLMDNVGNLIGQLKLGEMFFNPTLLTAESLDQLLNGLIRTYAKERSLELVDDLRNFLFFPPSSVVKLDLFSLNVQRNRDHGICSINEARKTLGMDVKKDFKDIFADSEKAAILQKLYQTTDKIDLWLGIIGEPALYNSALGELGVRINSMQFKNIRNGDKFWYENTFSQSLISQIKNTSFGDVIKRNTGVRYASSQTFKKL